MSALSKGPNIVDVSFPSPEDENKSIFLDVVSSSYLGFWMLDEVRKCSHPEFSACVHIW
jgi:hypothetical protein